MKAQGYQVDVPGSVDELREALLYGNAAQHGADANVHALISADDHVKRERWLKEIEAQWGPAPGRQLSNGSSIFVLGKQFGNVLVSVQPSFGYEGDPMRLLFEKAWHRRMPSQRSIATCVKISKLTRSFTLARMVHLNSCQVNNLA